MATVMTVNLHVPPGDVPVHVRECVTEYSPDGLVLTLGAELGTGVSLFVTPRQLEQIARDMQRCGDQIRHARDAKSEAADEFVAAIGSEANGGIFRERTIFLACEQA